MATIIIADYDGDMRELLKLTMQMRGHESVAVASGTDALAVASSNPHVDLMIIDANLAVLSGLEVTRIVRADHALCDLPVLLLSAGRSHADVEAGYEAGADDYVTKPFSFADLGRRVDVLLLRAA